MKEQKGRRKFPIYKATFDNKDFRMYKRMRNIAAILESGMVRFMEERLSPKAIVLFGSYQRGEDIEGSDVDIFVECKKEGLDLRRFEKQIGRKIELHFSDNFASYPKELKNNIMNGIVLSGFLEGYR
ncbi:nucleotidyltransferase domain-containing protein [Candidatus Woesearchaeota archaeon]|nr:nucleotidyltransferase domain-containing protein [Candidatus Woesearchaeota archaeon]